MDFLWWTRPLCNAYSLSFHNTFHFTNISRQKKHHQFHILVKNPSTSFQVRNGQAKQWTSAVDITYDYKVNHITDFIPNEQILMIMTFVCNEDTKQIQLMTSKLIQFEELDPYFGVFDGIMPTFQRSYIDEWYKLQTQWVM